MFKEPNISPGTGKRNISRKTRRRGVQGWERAFRTIQNISYTLDLSIEAEEPCYSILFSLISPYGLGLSSAFCFIHDPEENVLRGHIAFSPSSKTIFHATRRNIIKEFREQRRSSRADVKMTNSPHAHQGLNLAEVLGEQRQRVFQNLQSTTHAIRPITIDLSENILQEPGNILGEACGKKRVLRGTKSKYAGTVPDELLELLDEEFVLLPLTVDESLYYLIFADKKYQHRGFDTIDILKLDWFRTHASLLLRNSRLYKELRETYEDIKQIDDLKTNFLSVISHELRTPLTSIYGFLELLITGKAGSLSSTQHQLIDRALQNTHVLVTRVENLIELAHFHIEGIEDVTIESVDPVNCLVRVITQLESRSQAKNIVIEPRISKNVAPLMANKNALLKIFHHLLDNAIKFSPTDSTIAIEFVHHDDKETITFIDNGPGIEPNKLQKIFDYFYQIEEPMTRTYPGMGIGLTLTRLLLKATGGHLDVESVVGKGSKFSVTYPVAAP